MIIVNLIDLNIVVNAVFPHVCIVLIVVVVQQNRIYLFQVYIKQKVLALDKILFNSVSFYKFIYPILQSPSSLGI